MKTQSSWRLLASKTYCRCSSLEFIRLPRSDPSYRSTYNHRSPSQSTSAVKPLPLLHKSCRCMASKSKTLTGAPRCTQAVNHPRPNFQHFGKKHSPKLPRKCLTRFSPRSHTSWRVFLPQGMPKVHSRGTSCISRTCKNSGNLSKYPNGHSHL